jgi:tRNA pseudouridine32 synthase/23S rRNA pseudouridine746 synthase
LKSGRGRPERDPVASPIPAESWLGRIHGSETVLSWVVAKTDHVELPDGTRVPILYEDRGVLALDKPAGWMLGPEDEEHVRRNLHLALMDGIQSGAWWARCRGLRFLRFVHRLDAPTTGIILMVKSRGAITQFTDLFASRAVEKVYLAVTDGIPREEKWRCQLALGPVTDRPGMHQVDSEEGKPADTEFQRLEQRGDRALIEARPYTGRTHQIRLHLEATGCAVVGDVLYGSSDPGGLALRAVSLSYRDPFTGKPVRIRAPDQEFRKRFGFGPLPAAVPGSAPAPGTTPGNAPNSASGTTPGKPPGGRPAPGAAPSPSRTAPRPPQPAPQQRSAAPKQTKTEPKPTPPRRPGKPPQGG